VDVLFDQLRRRIPNLIVERLAVMHIADDDDVSFIGHEHGRDRIQLHTAPGGEPTFYVENGVRRQTVDVGEAVDIIEGYLEQTGRPPGATT
jgi:hypothetical protein